MLIEIRVPEMGHEANEVIFVAWHKWPGDTVAAEEPIADVMTDKVNIEVVSPAAGTLKEQRAAPDEVIAVGAVVATLETAP